MIVTQNTIKALNLAYKAHHNQYDKIGVPYIFHPYTVAETMKDEKTTILALLHDTLEDTSLTIEDIKKLNVTEDIITALLLLTHDSALSYVDYIKRLAPNRLARTVKLGDLYHNTHPSRVVNFTESDKNRQKKYFESIKYLEGKHD